MATFDRASKKSDSNVKRSSLANSQLSLRKAPAPSPTPQPAPNPDAPIHRDRDENGNPGWWSRLKFDSPRYGVQPKFNADELPDQQEQEADRPNQPAQPEIAPPPWATRSTLPMPHLQRQERTITPIPEQALAQMRSWSAARSTVPPQSQPASEPNVQAQSDPAPYSRPAWWDRLTFNPQRPSMVQAKLTVGAPNDQYEQEADAVAAQVMAMPEPTQQPNVQQQTIDPPNEEEEAVQTKPIAHTITPLLQREAAPEAEEDEIQPKLLGNSAIQREAMPEDEEIQAKPLAQPLDQRIAGTLQRDAMPEDEEAVQPKPLGNAILQREAMPEEEELQPKALDDNAIQREAAAETDEEELQPKRLEAAVVQREALPDEEEAVQPKPLANAVLQREEMPEDEDVLQTKSLGTADLQREALPEEEDALQTKSSPTPDSPLPTPHSLETQLSNTQGSGSPLPNDVRSFMEPRFGADLSQVRVHTGASAVQMNKDLSAQAFTHKQDIFFGAGKSPGKNDLTAHELTHVVQQTGAKTLQRKPTIALKAQKNILQTKISAVADGATVQRKSAPKSPQADPGFQAVVKRTETVAKQQKAHPPAKTKATEAQAAAVPPSNEKESKAQDRQVQEMNQQQPGQFNTAAFKAALMEKINAATPQNLDEANKFKDSNKLGSVKGDLSSQVGNEKKQAAGPIEEKTKEPPKTGGIPDKAVTPLPPPPPGSPPADIGAGQAAPKPKDASEISMQAGSQSLDQQMTDAKVTDEQLAKSNEPEFNAALGTKKEAQADAAKVPGDCRQKEQATLTQAQTQAQTAAQAPLQGMQGQKAQILSQVTGQQGTTKGQDEQKRAEIAGRIEGIYNTTKQKVETLLNSLDGEVNQEFDRGASTAKNQFDTYVDQEMKRFKDKRYSGMEGAALWVRDLFLPLPDEVNQFYKTGRQKYLDSMNVTIDRVANLVVTRLNAAKTEITNGKQEIQKYVASLDPSLRQLGQDAAQTINGKFDQLEQSVDNKQGELIDSLAQKYNENLQALDADIEKRKSENQGWVNKAKDAMGGVIQTILELKNMLMGMLAKASGAVEKIIKDPVGFLGNLVAGIKQGFMGFAGNITNHLKKGLIGWLTGSLASAGVEMPKSFDLKGIFALVTGILGLTYQGMRDRVANKVGEKKVSALEKGFDMFILWKNEGAAGLWKFIQDKLANLKEMVIGGIQSFVIDTIISAGVTWVLSLLNPASAFVRACKLIIDVIMFFVERGSQIAELVNAVLDSVGAIADGAIGVAAKLVEGALAKALPVVIGFLASLIGLGGISGKIQDLIKKARGLIDTAVNWVLSKALAFVKKLGGKLGFGKDKKGKPDERTPEQKEADLKKGLAEANKLVHDDKISAEQVKENLPGIKSKYQMTSLELVIDNKDQSKETVHVHGKINPEGDTDRDDKAIDGEQWKAVEAKLKGVGFNEHKIAKIHKNLLSSGEAAQIMQYITSGLLEGYKNYSKVLSQLESSSMVITTLAVMKTAEGFIKASYGKLAFEITQTAHPTYDMDIAVVGIDGKYSLGVAVKRANSIKSISKNITGANDQLANAPAQQKMIVIHVGSGTSEEFYKDNYHKGVEAFKARQPTVEVRIIFSDGERTF